MTFIEWFTVFLSYFIGSFPTAYLFGILKNHKDIREIGTKNMGALNAFRSVGPTYGILTYLIDGFKGYFPIYYALKNDFSFFSIGICMIMLLSGHNWSIFLKFHGGKGGSTSSGMILALFPEVFLPSLFIFIFLSILTSNVSFGLGVCFLFLPILVSIYSYSNDYVYLSIIIPLIGLIRIFPYFISMIRESNGSFNKMLQITIHGFDQKNNT